MYPQPHTVRRGFHPLTKLMIVFATLFVLAVVFFPILAKDRTKRRPSCISYLKNCSLALRMYSSDYDEHLPADGVPTIDGAPGWPTPAGRCRQAYSCGWPFAAKDYVKSDHLLCENWEKLPLVRRNQTAYWSTTYPLSECLLGAAEREIENAANKVMLYEILPYHHDQHITTEHKLDMNYEKAGMIVIAAFADGHCKVQNMNQSWGPTVPCRGANKWNLNAGWAYNQWNRTPSWDNKPDSFPCTESYNSDPLGASGRKGSNF